MRLRLGAAAIAILLTAVGCIGRGTRERESPAPSAWRDWSTAFAEADRLSSQGREGAADSVLADFVRRWPGTPQADEGTWWRVARQAERAEDSTSTALVMARIDSVLAASPATARRMELLTLRRVAALSQQLRVERQLARTERDASDAAAKLRTEELEKLKAELESVRAELERVRKRVTRRRP